MPAVENRKCLIVTALKMEAKSVADAFGRPLAPAGELVELGPGAALAIIGLGARLLQPAIFADYDTILLAGLGGALDPRLDVADLVLDLADSGDYPNLAETDHRQGKIYGSDHLIASVEEKERLFEETACLAVDMESHVVRPGCEAAGKKFWHLRAVSDRADEALPERMASWIDEVGEPKMSVVATDLAFRPHYLPMLLRLQKNSRAACERMVGAVKQIVDGLSKP
jgi:hypothetical protein